jgi:hypothetical protein
MTKAYDNSILARNINVSGVNTNVSGVLQLNNIDVSLIRSYATTSSFPVSGVSNHYYLASDSSRIYQWTGSQYVEIGAGFDSISANSITVGTISDARLSSAVAFHSQVNTTVGQLSNTVDSMPRVTAVGTITANSGLVVWSFFTPVVSVTVSQITMSTTGGAVLVGGTLARMGLYTYPTDGGIATLVARTASDTTLFTATNTVYTRSFDTTGGYPSTYTLQAGTRYGAAYICVGSTPPAVTGRSVVSAIAALSPRLSGLSTSQADLPITFVPVINGAAHFARLS